MVTLGGTIGIPGIRLSHFDPYRPTCTIVWTVESTLSLVQSQFVAWEIRSVATGKLIGTGTVTARSANSPTFSSFPSRMPGARVGQMCPVRGYAFTLDGDTLPIGTMVLNAVGHGQDGTACVMDPILFHNDCDGADRRPSANQVYWDFGGGNDANGGTGWGDAVATSARAITLAATSGNCGGATIYVRGNVTGSGGIGPSLVVLNTGNHWLTFVADSGATWNGAVGDWMTIRTPNPGSATEAVRLRFQGFVMISQGPHFYDGDFPLYRTEGHFWVEGGEWGSEHFDGGGVRARFGEDAKTAIIQFSQAYDKGNVYATGVYRRGAGICWSAHKLVFDCLTESFLAGDIYVSGPPFSRCIYQSLHFTDQAGVYNVTRGIGANQASGTSPREQLECQMIGPVMRILGPVGGSDFGTAMADNLGSTQTWAGVYDWAGRYPDPYPANPSLAGQTIPHVNNGVWEPLAAGQTGGRPYVDLDHAGGIAGMADLTWGSVETAQSFAGQPGSSGQRWNTKFHSSFLSVDNGELRTEGTVIRDVSTSNIRIEANSHFSNGSSHSPITRLLIDNVRDAGQNVSNFNMGGVDYLDCLFRRMSEIISTVGGDTGRIWTGTSFDNCVFNTWSSSMPDMIANGLKVSFCHFQTGGIPAGATNCTSGSWLDPGASPSAPPWAMTPAASHIGGGDPRMLMDPTFEWSGSNSTKGALRNVALINSDTMGLSGVTINATASAGTKTRTGSVVVDGFSVEPDPAIDRVGRAGPTVIYASVTRTGTTSARDGVAGPTVTFGGATIGAQVASNDGTAGPTVRLMSLTVRPAVGRDQAGVAAPVLTWGGVTIGGTAAASDGVDGPDFTGGAVEITPTAAIDRAGVRDPAVVVDGFAVTPESAIDLAGTAPGQFVAGDLTTDRTIAASLDGVMGPVVMLASMTLIRLPAASQEGTAPGTIMAPTSLIARDQCGTAGPRIPITTVPAESACGTTGPLVVFHDPAVPIAATGGQVYVGATTAHQDRAMHETRRRPGWRDRFYRGWKRLGRK